MLRTKTPAALGWLLLIGLGVTLTAAAIVNGIDVRLDIRQRLQPASSCHALGTDALGRDVLSCLIVASAASLAVALAVVFLSASIGALLGFAAAWNGGPTNACIMRGADLILSLPGILLCLTLMAFWGPGMVHLVVALVGSGWAGYARLVRAESLELKQREFILAARGFNAPALHIACRHIAPRIFPLLANQAVLGVSSVILLESSLGYLGLGLDPRLPSLGQMIDAGRPHLFVKPLLTILPGGCLVALTAAFLLLADGGKSAGKENRIEN